jgi:hypothetical protein
MPSRKRVPSSGESGVIHRQKCFAFDGPRLDNVSGAVLLFDYAALRDDPAPWTVPHSPGNGVLAFILQYRDRGGEGLVDVRALIVAGVEFKTQWQLPGGLGKSPRVAVCRRRA